MQDFTKLKILIDEVKTKTDAYIEGFFSKLKPISPELHRAMAYSVVGRGKRLRAVLVFLTAKPFGLNEQTCLALSLCIEMAHAYSLIHDDLPCLDNDTERSGKPCSHIVFGEALALLSGNSLLTLCIEVLSGSELNLDDAKKLKVINTFCKAFGYNGVMGGQVLDVAIAKNNKDGLTIEEIYKMQRLKTGEFFAFCTSIGALLCGTKKEYEAYKAYGHSLGKIYQIVDDVIDDGQDSANSVLNFFATKQEAINSAKAIADDYSKINTDKNLEDFLYYIINLI
jgi:geranylgeranyl pyrophosphate synthase